MKPKLKTGLIAAVPLALFMGLGMALGNTLGLQGWGYRLFWMGFAALGAVLGSAIYWFMQRMRSGKEVPAPAALRRFKEASAGHSGAHPRRRVFKNAEIGAEL